ncbi:NAD-dependent epimerase/dehydratase family protein [Virgibacillus halodenitrificans]|uniref:NAD-dependent epimerase/dehydratase family protein n=1 Tax=Virgibacillus halodenitrificans TaxID=1482 RepID=UPI0024C03F81|nr:NAD-dependent epimerase/dehydratase family protein [Virgibacillus halodenitrificans]WHX27873.1 NAD-dependent epimerase/dehydratase family protein [Virgibacillus halodenitrificans]
MAKTFVLGGTGLLGFQTIKELLAKGYEVKTIARKEKLMNQMMPEEVEKHLGDINTLSDEEIVELLRDCDSFVYAAGVDERTIPQAPAEKFYYEQNVLPTQRLARLSKRAGVKKFVIHGSYHVEFAEKWQDLNLFETEAYPRTRKLQEEIAFMEGGNEMDVMALRLPYIFGTMPGRTPLWKMFLPQVEGKDVVPVLQGGTAMVTVKQVAEATVGALENGEHQKSYAICGENMSYAEFYKIIAEALEQEDTEIKVVPLEQMKPSFQKADEKLAYEGKERAIHAAQTAEMQNRGAYLDPKETMPVLNYQEDDIKEAIIESIKKAVNC